MVEAIEPVLPDRPPGPHPTPEQLYRARRGPRSAEAERWLAHAATCATCTELLLHQEAFDAPDPVSPRHLAAAWERFGDPAAQTSGRIANVAKTPVRGFSWAGALAAAAVASVLGLGVWTASHSSPHAPQDPHSAHPSNTAASLRGSAEAAGDRQPSGILDAPPTEIVFPVPDGDAKRVTVFDAHGYTWTSPPTANGRVPFPAAERQRLRKGVDYFWTVVGEEGSVARSFRLR
jgi:hypothetical protein